MANVDDTSSINNGEVQYLNLIDNILKNGISQGDRTGVGTKSIFGAFIRYDIREGRIPLYTTRKIFFRGAIEELLWMFRGETDANILAGKNINIWNGNTTREFLDNRGLPHLKEGDIGALYGFQMRHWGAEYNGCGADYTGQGIDQIKKVVDLIKNNPESRRILMSNYNVSQLEMGVLEPCHTFFQFYVDKEKSELSGLLYMRSVDMLCGQPLNVVFYSVLIHLIAAITGFKTGEFIFTSGDTHVYNTHIDNALIMLERTPFEAPTLSFKSISTIEDIERLEFKDFTLVNYIHHPRLSFPMAV